MRKAVILNSIFMVLIILLILFSVRIEYFFPLPDTGLTEQDIPKQAEPIDTSMGTNPDAPIDMIVFEDFSCFFCRDTYPAVKQIREEYKTNINYVFKHLPQGQDSLNAHIAAECSRDHGLFIEFHDAVYESGDLSNDNIIDIAESLDIDINQFKSCIGSDEKESVIMRDIKDAELNSITGTPIFIINGDIIVGSQSYDSLKDIIDKQLDPERIVAEILGGSG